MRIFHIRNCYLRLTETFIYNFILLSSHVKDAEIYIIVHETINLEQFPLPENVKILEIKKRPSNKLIERFVGINSNEPFWYYGMARILRQYKPDLVHCHFGDQGTMFNDFLERKRVSQQFAVSFYGYDAGIMPFLNSKFRDDLLRLWNNCSAIFCEGPSLMEKVTKLGARRECIYLSPIPIDTLQYPVREFANKNGEWISFLVIGRFIPKKGFHIFLTALGLMKMTGFSSFSVTMVGEGKFEDEYARIIKEFDMSEHINFTGLIPLKECKQLMVDKDVLVHPSLEDKDHDTEGGAPTILIEAQVIGIPVIATTHADIPFVMGYQDFLCRENDTDDLIRIIDKFRKTSSTELENLISIGKEHAIKQHDFKNSPYPSYLNSICSKGVANFNNN